MEKRLIIAIVLSILVIVTFQRYAAKTSPQPLLGKVAERVQAQRPIQVTPDETTRKEPALSGSYELDENEHFVETDRFILSFSNIGGAIKGIRLKDFTSPNADTPLVLASTLRPKEYILLVDDPMSKYSFSNAPYKLSVGRDIVVYDLLTEGIELKKTYLYYNYNYDIELRLSFKNLSDTTQQFTYRIIGGSGILEPSRHDKRFVEVVSNIDGAFVKFKRPKGHRIINNGIVSWTALKNKYFSVILKPFIATKSQFCQQTENGSFLTGVTVQSFSIPPNATVEHKYMLYVGPSDISILKSYGLGLEESVHYGIFGGISKVVLRAMRFFYGISHNWGVAIICLTFALNVLLFPLTHKSFKSMQRMQSIQPEMMKLKEQHKKNPQKLNKEMMELYKKHKVNPFGGCLPILLQMPVFIALYQGLTRSIELKGAKFLWIKDLSQPDSLRIPFELPLLGKSINILPLLMVGAMFLQQRLSSKAMGAAQTPEQQQQQKMMMILMPVMFGFIFYNLPSGLVLYWLTNTALMTTEQAMMYRKSSG